MMDSETGKLDIVLDASADKVLQAVDKVNAKFDQMTAKAQASAAKITGGNQKAADSVAAVAAGVQKNIEAFDKLGQKSDAVLGKQHTAWLAVSAVVGGATGSMITKIISFVDRVNSIPDAVEAAFKPMIQSAWLANDSLRVSNAQIENQIALLEKKPQNNAAVALAEARVEADNLATALDSANTKMEAILSTNHIAMWKQLLGKGSTANVEGTINSLNQEISDLAYQRQAALRSGNQGEADRLDRDRRSKLAYAHTHYGQMLSQNKDGKFKDNQANRTDLEQADTVVMAEQDADTQRDQGSADKARLKVDQDRQRAQEAAKAAAAEANKAAELRLKGMEGELAKMKNLAPQTAKSIYDYWDMQITTFAVGSAQYNVIAEKQAAINEAWAAKVTERFKRFREQQIELGAEASKLALLNPMGDWNRDAARAAADQRDSSNEANAQSARNVARYTEVQIQEQSGRTMTAIAAATALAAVHTREYGAELFRVQERLKAIQTDPSLSSGQDDKQKKIDELVAQVAQIQANRNVQVLQDKYSITPPNTTLMVGATSALEDFVRATTNAGETLKNVFSSALSSTNEGILRALTTRHTNGEHIFGNIGGSIFKNVAGAGLQGAEGTVLKAFGLGGDKTLGASEAHAMWVRMTGFFSHGASTASSAGVDALGRLGLGDAGLPGGKGGESSGLGGLLQTVIPFIPGFADGVDNFGGGMAFVGERGPELVHLPSGASVTPNHKLGDRMMGKGSGDFHLHIDARGATDPAQTMATINDAFRYRGPQIMAATMHYQMEQRKRKPSSVR